MPSNYSYLFEYFKEDEIKEAFLLLNDISNLMIDHIVRNVRAIDNSYFKISNDLIKLAVLDSYADLARLMEFHEFDGGPNCLKKGAYLSYWFARRKPIQIIKELKVEFTEVNDRVPFINESVAMNLALRFPFAHPTSVPNDVIDRFNNFKEMFYYYFRFRLLTPQAIELALTGYACSDYIDFSKPSQK